MSIKLCECGCGQPTKLAPQGNTRRGWVSGQPMRFLTGHTSRRSHTLEERFWNKIDKNGPIHPVLGTRCWLWTGAHQTFGHGVIRLKDTKKNKLVHRLSYEIHYGSIPEGLNILHRCDNPPCCNPEHLFAGTQKDNIQDAIKKGRPGYLDWKRKTK